MDTLIDHRTDRIQFIRTLYALSYSQFSGYNRYIMRSLHSLASGRKNTGYWYKLFRAGTYLILLGLAFEAYEGGIRKDPSTYSYYFLASGLAFMAMIAFSIMCDIYSWSRLTRPLEYAGQNPMIAYVSTQLVVLPLLNLADWEPIFPIWIKMPGWAFYGESS